MFRRAPRRAPFAALGAAVMGIWSAYAHSAGSAMQRERWHGTLELLVARPAPFALVMLPMTIAMSSDRPLLDGRDAALGRVLFGIHVHIEHWALFCLSVAVDRVSIGLARLPARRRVRPLPAAWALGNLFEYPSG
jgi:ABC-2 type transport system permease protein